jgi:hypothetical protein
MTLTEFSLGAIVTDDHRLEIDDRRVLWQQLRHMKPGRKIVRISEPKTKRSLDQNAYLHAVPFPLIAAEVGDSIEGVKYDLMGEKWGWKPSALDPTRMVPVKPSTSSMTVEECTEFIEWLIPFAAQKLNCVIPLPNEYTEVA